MSHINMHPAPGLGDLVPGFFVVPQNPILPVRRVMGMGEFIEGKFIVPQNPILAALGLPQGIQGLKGDCGCGCNGGGGCRQQGTLHASEQGMVNGRRVAMDGMGNILDDATAAAQDAWTQVTGGGNTTYLAIGAGVLLLFLFSRGSGGDSYRQELAKLRSKYPTRARRARRAISAATGSY